MGLFISPVRGLIVSNNAPISGAIKIENVTLCSNQFKQNLIDSRRFQGSSVIANQPEFSYEAYAITEEASLLQEDFLDQYSKMQRAIYLLAATSLECYVRRSDVGFGMVGQHVMSSIPVIFISDDNNNFQTVIQNYGGFMPLSVDDDWLTRQSTAQVNQILQRINDTSLDPNWRRQIRQGALMMGRSLLSPELADAFLLNVIGLETLLTRRQERNGRVLAKRVKGLVGWNFVSTSPNIEDRVREIHEIRCEVVHDSDYSNMTLGNLLWSDLILRNCLRNIVLNPSEFNTKDNMIALIDSYADNSSWPKKSPSLSWIEGNQCLNTQGLVLFTI